MFARFTRPIGNLCQKARNVPRLTFARQNFNYKHNFKFNQKRFFTAGSSAWQSNYMLGAIGLAALVGGAVLLNNINTPAIVDSSGTIHKVADLEEAKSLGAVRLAEGTIPKYVQNYLYKTYEKVVLGLGITAGAAVLAFKSGLAHRIARANPLLYSLGTLAGIMGAGMWVRSVSPRDTVHKHIAFAAFNSVIGLSICFLGFLNPSILFRAGLYTAGMVSALSYVAMTAKQDKYLYMGGPLLAGLAVVTLSGFASLLLPATMTRTLAVTEALWLYGGLALFGAFLLYDTQVVMKHARVRHEKEKQIKALRASGQDVRMAPPDYINECIGIYMDIIQIFIRLVYILAGNKRK
jgi:FtsH-binding integral membrane protein